MRKIDLVGNEMDRLRTILEEEAGESAADGAGRTGCGGRTLHERESI